MADNNTEVNTLSAETGAPDTNVRPYYGPSAVAKLLQDIGINLQTYFGGIFLFVGILGNILCIIIFSRKSMRRLNVNIFLRVLAVVDLLFLITGQGLVAWPDTVFNMRYINHSRIACKIYYLVIGILRQASAWLIVGFTIERCIAITYPLKFRSIPEPTIAKMIYSYITILLTASTIYNIHGLVLFDLVPDGEGFECDPVTEKSPTFIKYIRPWISIGLVAVIPFTVILICNSMIIKQIKTSQSFRGADKSNDDNEKMKSIAIMLMTVSFIFLILNLPLSLALFLTRVYPPSFWYGSFDARAKSDFMWKFSLCTLYLNSSLNFFCYAITGRAFRSELRAMVLVVVPRLAEKTKSEDSSGSA
ncbi:hypothetical protein CAPTEDRAFT_197121 [Capitella teleta]|uniref:G-protein coupled receptors family 1 profile domain-containing protein n=1 Tax=Capitella teleta TaxID=283909 RepID=R7TRQ0_CAPTE|nr:hypothetical protein CAPTEDRAFT_197121 [Capitella teleta]|eukprot:ELT93710.1 hypothetical protein CAPTEDRAFT_197121 [Capitella teleta]